VILPPVSAAVPADVLQADGYLLGTPANIGYMPGTPKRFLDGVYHPCPEAAVRRPYGRYVPGGMDTGAVRAVQAITTGPRWQEARPLVCVTGTPAKEDPLACWEPGALRAAEVAGQSAPPAHGSGR
jgi:hypothetical protein